MSAGFAAVVIGGGLAPSPEAGRPSSMTTSKLLEAAVLATVIAAPDDIRDGVGSVPARMTGR